MTKESIYEKNGSKIGGVAAEALEQFFQRIENLQEEIEPLKADIKDVFSQAKSQGFDVKIMRSVLKLRKIERAEREEQQELLDLYLAALGMV